MSAGEEVELVVKSDEPGELHVHADPEQVLEYAAGTTTGEGDPRPAGRGRGRAARARGVGAAARSRLTWPKRLPLAHGLGGPADLPIPPELAIVGAVAALVVSFTVLALAWRTPRYDAATRPAGTGLAGRLVDRSAFAVALRALGLLGPRLVRPGRGLRPEPADQPGLRHVLRVVVGRPGARCRCCSARSGRRSARSAPSTRSSPGSPGATPTAGSTTYPERLGHWPAAVGPVRLRLARAGLPALHRARPGPAVVRGVRRR